MTYTIGAVAVALAVVAVEVGWARTRLFTRLSYWVTMAIVFFFQTLVDGVLTDHIVVYDGRRLTGLHIAGTIPIEDYAYGFALATLTLVLWVRAERAA